MFELFSWYIGKKGFFHCKMVYNETCVKRTPLAPTFVYGIDRCIQGKLTKISYINTLFKDQFIQFSVLFRVRFNQVSLYCKLRCIAINGINSLMCTLMKLYHALYPIRNSYQVTDDVAINVYGKKSLKIPKG